MGKSSGKAPRAPDPRVVIPLQTKADKESFDYVLGQQRATSVTPGGTQGWTQTPGPNGVPQWTYTETLSPDQQAIYDADSASSVKQAQLLGQGTQRVTNALNTPYSQDNVPELTTKVDPWDQTGALDYSRGLADRSLGDNYNQTVSDAAYNKQKTYLDPEMAQQRRALDARLADQGFAPGTPGYAQAMQTFQDTNNRAYSSARDSAVEQGYAQGNTQLGLQSQIAQLLGNSNNQNLQGQIAGGTFQNQAIQQLIAQQLQQRNQPLNELNALRTGAQVQGPSGQAQYSSPNLNAPDVIGAYNNQYQGRVSNYNAKQASNNGVLGALGGLAGSFFGPIGGAIGSKLGTLFSGK